MVFDLSAAQHILLFQFRCLELRNPVVIESKYRCKTSDDWPKRHHYHSRQVILSVLGSLRTKLVGYINRYNLVYALIQ